MKTKGQTKPKEDWRTIDSPKKRMNEFGFSAMTVRKYLKLEVKFQVFPDCKGKKNGSFGFWENLLRANLLTVLFDLYKRITWAEHVLPMFCACYSIFCHIVGSLMQKQELLKKIYL